MIVVVEDSDLFELITTGKNRTYRNVEKDKVLMDGLQRAIRIMKSVNNIEDLKLYSYLHYEKLRYHLSGQSSVRLANGRVHRLLFIEEDETKHIMEAGKRYILNDIPLAQAVHPGGILQEELRSRKISQKDFAANIGMQASHLSALIHGVRNITADIAQRLEMGLGIPAYIWLNLQTQYNLGKKRKETHSRTKEISYDLGGSALPAATLCEPESPVYGTSIQVSVRIPAKDKELLRELSERMGWTLWL